MRTAKPTICNLTKVIKKLEKTKEQYHCALEKSELLTRYVLIDPLLRALGWDTKNPEEVRVDHKVTSKWRKKADYILFKDKEAVALIEAKKYG